MDELEPEGLPKPPAGMQVYSQKEWASKDIDAVPIDPKSRFAKLARRFEFFKASLIWRVWGEKKPEKALESLAKSLWKITQDSTLVSLQSVSKKHQLKAPDYFIIDTTKRFESAFEAFWQEEPISRKDSLGIDKEVEAISYLNCDGQVLLSQLNKHFSTQAIIIWIFISYLLLKEEQREESRGLANIRLFSSSAQEWLEYVRSCLLILERAEFK